MKCKKLIVSNLKGGSPWPVMECGGAYVDNGDTIIVDARIGQRFLTQYMSYLTDGGECEMESLSGGHYQIEKANKTDQSEKPKPVEKNDEPTEMPEPETKERVADDRSMEGRGRKKKKAKKTK